MKKNILTSLAAILLTASASAQFKFTDIVRLPCMAIQDQAFSGTCWCFSSMSFIESEMMAQGIQNPPNLSEMYVVRQNYIDRAQKHVMLHGKMNFGEGSYFLDNFIVARQYGLMPESAYPNTLPKENSINHSILASKAERFADSVANDNNKKLNLEWLNNYTSLINQYLPAPPEKFEYNGKEYTPQSFLKEVVKLDPNNYIQVTSFSHHEFYKTCILELPDNWRWEPFFNVKVDDLTAIIDTSLAMGHTVLWAADVSENGFNSSKGYALLPGINPKNMKPNDIEAYKAMTPEKQLLNSRTLASPGIEMNVTQESRQTDFLNRNTTDDHGMHLIGAAKDQNGNKFYIVKNSWGNTNQYGGYIYVSVNYVKAKTTGILVNKDVVDKMNFPK